MDITRAPSTVVRSAKLSLIKRVIPLAPLVIALGMFFAIALHQLQLPGFYYDEALDLVPMLNVMRGEQPELLRNIGLSRFPIMLLDYMGSLNGYLSIPFMALFHPGLVAARAEPIFFSGVTIVLTWLLARRWFGNGVAAFAVLLLAVNPSFIWFSRQGISVTSVMTVFSLGSLLLFDHVIQRESRGQPEGVPRHLSRIVTRIGPRWLALGAGILLGLGLWAKFLFFRWIAVMVVMGIVFLFTRSQTARRIHSQREHIVLLMPALIFGVIGLILGSAPLIYYNIAGLIRDGQLWTLALLLGSLLHPTQQFSVNNADFAHNLQTSVEDVRVFIDGSYFWYNGVPFSNVYAVPAVLVSAAAGAVLSVLRGRHLGSLPLAEQRRRDEARRFVAILIGIIVLVFLGAFTVTGLWSTHQFIMLPLPQLVVACAAVWLGELLTGLLAKLTGQIQPATQTGYAGQAAQAKQPFVSIPEAIPAGSAANLAVSKPGPVQAGLGKWILPLVQAGLAACLLALPFSRDLWVNEQHHNTLAVTGGSGRFSDAVYKLSTWLDENAISQPIALDWGIEKQVRVLTADRVQPLEIFGYSPTADDAFRQRARDMLADPSRSYIVLWDRFAVYNRRKDFTDLANQMGKHVVETYIAHEKSGLPVYVVLQAK